MKLKSVFTALAVAVGCVTHAHAQAYPSRPITIIVPFPAGGPSDTLARILGERMRISLGQPVVVETVTGAGASIGVARAAQSAPDGYTLSIGNWTSHVGAGAMYPAAHDAVLELQPISRISATPLMIVGKNALPPQNARELIAWLKANPGKASAATIGAGSGAHVCLLYFAQKTGTNFPARPVSRRRAGHAGSDRGADRHVLRRGLADALVPAQRRDEAVRRDVEGALAVGAPRSRPWTRSA